MATMNALKVNMLELEVCKLGPVGCGCSGLNKDGACSVYYPEGVRNNVNKGSCNYRNSRAPNVGIYKIKGALKKNPLKVSKAAS